MIPMSRHLNHCSCSGGHCSLFPTKSKCGCATRRCLRTNNPLERLMREIRRRTRVVGAFPDGQSALMLVAARLRHVAATKWGTKRYLQMDRLAEVVAIA